MENLGILFNVTIWTICAITFLILGINQIKRNDKYIPQKNYFIIFIFFLAYSLFTGFGGDNERYSFFFEEGYKLYFMGGEENIGIEPLYAYIAKFVNGNFLLWKLVVYGSCLLITFITIKRFKVKNDITLMFYSLMCLSSIGTTRAVLAYSIFLLGYSFIKEKEKKQKLFGCFIIVFSYFAHSSMIVPILLTPFVFIKINKKIVYTLIILFPVLIYLFNTYYNVFLAGDYYYVNKFETYNEYDYATTRSKTMNILNNIMYFVIIPPIYYGLKSLFKENASTQFKHIIRFTFLLLYFTFVILFSKLDNPTFFNRYFTMIPFFLFIYMSEIIKERSFSLNKIYFYVGIVSLHGFGLMYYILYCYLI